MDRDSLVYWLFTREADAEVKASRTSGEGYTYEQGRRDAYREVAAHVCSPEAESRPEGRPS